MNQIFLPDPGYYFNRNCFGRKNASNESCYILLVQYLWIWSFIDVVSDSMACCVHETCVHETDSYAHMLNVFLQYQKINSSWHSQ